jgi:hypothetical protein
VAPTTATLYCLLLFMASLIRGCYVRRWLRDGEPGGRSHSGISSRGANARR